MPMCQHNMPFIWYKIWYLALKNLEQGHNIQ